MNRAERLPALENDTDRLLEAQQVAEIIGMTADYVYALARRGEIPHLRFGRSVRFRPDDIDRWLEGRLIGDVA